jgi:uridylate kinase
MSARYKRILLKLSGEAFGGRNDYGIDMTEVDRIARDLVAVHRMGVQTAVVIGGGNIVRGAQMKGVAPIQADYMGMMATMINALAMQDALERAGVPTRVMAALETKQVAEPYIRRRAIRHLEKGRIVIFGGGTGLPRFTTDTTAAVRALEIEAQVLIKATGVDGVYDSDPRTNPKAKRYERISFQKVMEDDLRVMDQTAIAHCRENRLPIIVLSLRKSGNIVRAVKGAKVGTTVG